ncbi:6-phosphogluconolactonase-like protein [Lachancea thermotolerans]
MVPVYTYDDSAALSRDLALYILAQQDAALQRGGRFNLAVSGGSLLKALRAGLVEDAELRARANWARWHVFFCDERIVPLEHADSNYGAFKAQVLDPLLQHDGVLGPTCYAINESLVGLGENDRLAAEYESLLPAQFDLILLGCGPDGHTCSLFPGDTHSYLLDANTDRRVAWCHSSPKPPADRITFTLPTLASAHALCFVAEGAAKQPVLQRILQSSPDTSLPAALVTDRFAQRVSWFVDSAAVQDLSVPAVTYNH